MKAQASFEFLLTFLLLLFLIAILGLGASDSISSAYSSYTHIYAKQELSSISLNSGMQYATSSARTNANYAFGKNISIKEGTLHIGGAFAPTINPAVGGNYVPLQSPPK